MPAFDPPGGARTFCLFSQSYPPGPNGGIARYMHQLARSVAALGHRVHVLTRGTGKDRVDFEDGVWVHRIVPRHAERPPLPGEIRVPQAIWDHAATMLREVERIAGHRMVDCVYAPLWDAEGLAVHLDGRFPLVVALQTPMRLWLASHGHMRSNEHFMAEIGRPMLALEKILLEGATGIHAISAAIVHEIAEGYAVTLEPPRVTIAPLGLEDWTLLPSQAPLPVPDGAIRLLFVGRLEARKGIDVLLATAKRLLRRYPHVHLDIVGNDSIPGPGDVTHRAAFEADPAMAEIRDRIAFHGEVGDEALRGFYRACDIFVAPSRYESFGLILLEGMMFRKPVVGCSAGGMVEIVEDGETGLLAEPGDAGSLEACLSRLIEDPELRARLGSTGRRLYEEAFTPERMATDVVDFLARVAAAEPPETASPPRDLALP
jgi:glycosyltransferase involved in cell wall biosynthesis